MQLVLSEHKHPDGVMPLQAEDLKQWLLDNDVSLGEKIAVAVSGGADSMCLALLASEVTDVIALIVDHGLRAESTSEAEGVQQQLRSLGIKAEILSWGLDEKPVSNIQAEAREARYRLMTDWCRERHVSYLFVAHHQDDQAETILLRMARGSGLAGLAGMPAKRDLAQGLTLVRPLLGVPKARIIKTLQQRNIAWVDDPSNESEKFDRVKARKFLVNPPLPGLSAARLADTANHLRRAKDAIEHYVARWLDDAVVFHDAGFAEFDTNQIHDVPDEISLRGLACILRFASGASYSPRFEKLFRLWQMLHEQSFSGGTLNGAQLTGNRNGRVIVFREAAAVNAPSAVDKWAVWDRRFQIVGDPRAECPGITLGALGADLTSDMKVIAEEKNDFPASILPTLPAFFEAGRLIAVPHLGYDDSNQKLPILAHLWLASSENGKKTYRDVQ